MPQHYPKKKNNLIDQFKLSIIETTKKNGLYWAAVSFWSTGIGVLALNNQFSLSGGTPYDTVSGYIDLAALALDLAGNPTYSLTAFMAVVASGIQQYPYMAEGNKMIMASYAIYTLGTIPAILEKWIEPLSVAYLKKTRGLGFKSAAALIGANGRATAAVIQSLCHLPTAYAAIHGHDYALALAMGLFIIGNACDGSTKQLKYQRKPKEMSL